MDSRKDIDFIARQYRRGRFSADAGWRRVCLAAGFQIRRRRFGIAAALAALIALSATAALIYRNYEAAPAEEKVVAGAPVRADVAASAKEVKAIDFEDAPLTEVVDKIEKVYGVKVAGMPENADGYRLSLHYEGTAADLLATVNELLGTELIIAEK